MVNIKSSNSSVKINISSFDKNSIVSGAADSTQHYSNIAKSAIEEAGLILKQTNQAGANAVQSLIDKSAELEGSLQNYVSSARLCAEQAQHWAEEAANVQIQSDWNVADSSSKAFILNKPANVSQFTNDSNYQSLANVNNIIESKGFATVSELESGLDEKLDVPLRYVVETSDASILPSWYVVYSDGWIEQGGRSYDTSAGPQNDGTHLVTINLLKSYSNNHYGVNITQEHSGWCNIYAPLIIVPEKTTTSFQFKKGYITTGGTAYGYSWRACGY